MKHVQNRKIILLSSYIVVIALTVIVAAVCFDIAQSNKGTEPPEVICASTSADGKYNVEVISYKDPIYFAPHSIGIKIGPTKPTHSMAQNVVQLEISNDGGMVKETDVSFVWSGDTVTMIISASEQPDVTYKISFSDDDSYILERQFK